MASHHRIVELHKESEDRLGLLCLTADIKFRIIDFTGLYFYPGHFGASFFICTAGTWLCFTLVMLSSSGGPRYGISKLDAGFAESYLVWCVKRHSGVPFWRGAWRYRDAKTDWSVDRFDLLQPPYLHSPDDKASQRMRKRLRHHRSSIHLKLRAFIGG